MGSVAKRENGRWRARWRDPDGSERAAHFATKAQAQLHVAKMTAAVDAGTYLDHRDAAIPFGVFAEAWRLAQIHSPATQSRTETLIRVHMLPNWEYKRLGAIRPTEVQAWVKGLSPRLAPATIESVYGLFATIMRAAVLDRLLAVTPCVKVQLPRVDRTPVVPLPVDAVTSAVAAMAPELAAAVLTSAAAGLRISEVLGLTVDRVEFLRRTITVDRQAPVTGDRWEFRPPKTRASRRTIPIPDVLAQALAAHLAERPADEFGFIFHRPDGGPWSRRQAADRLDTATRKVENWPTDPHGTWHDLRHFYASVLIHSGASASAVQARLGHATAAETLDTYTHLFPAEDDRTRAALDAALGSTSEATPALAVAGR
jgi:integrase